MSTDITLTDPQPVEMSSADIVPVIAKIEDLLEQDQIRTDIAFFACLAICIVSQYPGMSDDQISKGLDRIALNIVQMCQEFEFENKLREQQAEKSRIITSN